MTEASGPETAAKGLTMPGPVSDQSPRPNQDWCGGCGLCCMHMRTPPFLGESDPRWRRLPQKLREQIRQWVLRPSPRYTLMVRHDGAVNPCIWLNLVTGQCRHYDLRPDVCRDYEIGSRPCREVRVTVGLTVKGMPVVDEGQLGAAVDAWAKERR